MSSVSTKLGFIAPMDRLALLHIVFITLTEPKVGVPGQRSTLPQMNRQNKYTYPARPQGTGSRPGPAPFHLLDPLDLPLHLLNPWT